MSNGSDEIAIAEIERTRQQMDRTIESLKHNEGILHNNRNRLKDVMKKLVSESLDLEEVSKLKNEVALLQKEEFDSDKEIIRIEKQFDLELQKLRRVYLRGTVSSHKQAQNCTLGILDPYWWSPRQKAIESCKSYLISTQSGPWNVGESSSTFHKLWYIPESSIVVGGGRIPEKYPNKGLVGYGSNGTSVYVADYKGECVAVKVFETPIPSHLLAMLKDLESHKCLNMIHGIIVPECGIPLKMQLVMSLSERKSLLSVFQAGNHVISFFRKTDWASSIAQALEWLHLV
eukprot:TRINITY_DN10391_c0_g1_i11.p1 TRINITY_DN10391_c0_g1~~TRINITY_DN10391_c0_g1_i11.p1  ORF type:complete len:288 (-),score=53.91 TRINITY_DN10391_c0_g1_i11:1377-2240(-)